MRVTDGDPHPGGVEPRESIAPTHRPAGIAQRPVDTRAHPGEDEGGGLAPGRDAQGVQPAGQVSAPDRELVGGTGRLGERGRGGGLGHEPQCQRAHGPVRLVRSEGGDELGVTDDVAGADAGDGPGLRQGADDEQAGEVTVEQALALAGHRVDEGLVDEHDPPRAHERADRVGRVQHARRVGRVADDDEVGVPDLPERLGREREALLRPQQHVPHLVPGSPQRGLRLGELGVHDHRVGRRQRSRDQREGLGPTARRQHLLPRHTVSRRQRVHRPGRVRVGRHGPELLDECPCEPLRRLRQPHVDRQVHQVVRHLGVAMMPQRIGHRSLEGDRGRAVRQGRGSGWGGATQGLSRLR